MPSERIRFILNDRPIEVREDLPGTTTLLRYLRDHLHLMGTKEGCAEGDCGACTVVLVDEDPPAARAVNACLLFLPMVHGRHVWTVEGLRDPSRAMQDPASGFHPVQQVLVDTRGSQCGYCTPGVVLSLLEAAHRDDLDPGDLRGVDEQLAGNLCRCTGYRPIREAGLKIAGTRPDDAVRACLAAAAPVDAELAWTGGGQTYLQPVSLEALWDARRRYPDAVLVAGGTDVGLRVTKDHARFPAVIGLGAIPELQTIARTRSGWRVGAGVTLTRLQREVAPTIPALDAMLRVFGSRQVRNRGTVGGNLCNASPIGDLAPVLLALDATLHIVGPSGSRTVGIDAFFLGYRKTALATDEVLAGIEVGIPRPSTRCASYKVSKRREVDISTVSAAMALDLDAEGNVETARLAWGGVAAVPMRARRTEEALRGRRWDADTLRDVLPVLDQDMKPISDPRGSAGYRMRVAKNLLRGFFLETWKADACRAQTEVTP